MAIPKTLGKRLMSVAPAGGAGPMQHNIGIPIEHQQGDNWCWAAVSVSLRNFQTPGSPLRQCELAQIQLSHNDCCTTPLPAACDQTNFLEIALANAGVAADNFPGSLSFSDLCDRLRINKAVCCAIQWFSGGFHFVQVDGFIRNGARGDEVVVNDPLNPGGRMTYNTLVTNYGTDAGQWVWTYRVL